MPGLVPIVLKAPGRENGDVRVEVRIGSEVVVSLPTSVDAQWLGTLLRTVVAC
jgi:hypothetical protein